MFKLGKYTPEIKRCLESDPGWNPGYCIWPWQHLIMNSKSNRNYNKELQCLILWKLLHSNPELIMTSSTLNLVSVFSSNEALLEQKSIYKDVWSGCHLCHQKKNILLSQTYSFVNLHTQNSKMRGNCCIPITFILFKHLLLKLYVYVYIWLRVDWTSQKV